MTQPAQQIPFPSDEELLKREIEIDDPHSQEGLLNHIPEGIAVRRIVNAYRYSQYPKQKAFCSKCEARRHRDGFTAELETGDLVLLGSHCGAQIWGESWEQISKTFNTERERWQMLLSFGRMVPRLMEMQSAFEKWRLAVRIVAMHRATFAAELGDVFRKLQMADQRFDGALTVEEKQRDYAAEEAYRRRYHAEPNRPVFKFVPRPIGRLTGSAYLNPNLQRLFDDALENLKLVIEAGQNTSAFNRVGLIERKNKVRDAFEALTEVAKILRGSRVFFSYANLAIIASWLEESEGRETFSPDGSHRRHIRYEAKGNTLTDKHQHREVSGPQNLPSIDLNPLKELGALI